MRVRTYGSLNGGLMSAASQLLMQQYKSIELRSSLTPPIELNTADLLDDSPPGPVTKMLKPTLILRGPGGEQVMAPYGVAGDGTWFGVVFVCAVFGAGWLFGRWTER